jgi:hypothetical protein
VVVAALDVVETCVGAVFEKANTSNTAAPSLWVDCRTPSIIRSSESLLLVAGRSTGETGTNDKQAHPLVLRSRGGELLGLVRNSTYLMP